MSKPIVPNWVAAVGAMIVISGAADLLRRRSRPSRVASKIYGLIVTAARKPALYEHAKVADTLEGRFEAVTLFTVLVLDRLLAAGSDGATVARALVEALIADMDDQMREMGVGDLTVPKRVKKAAAAVYDRLAAYRPALAAADAEALTRAFVTTGLLHDAGTDDARSAPGWPTLADHALDSRRLLAATDVRAVLDGRVEFPEYRARSGVSMPNSGGQS